jgi:hypothetical protein
MQVKSKKGGVKYTLTSGPKGMEVTTKGEVRWMVPAVVEDKEVDVIVSVSDSAGQEAFHNFRLRIE